MRPPASYDLRIQSDDDCSRAIALRALWDVLRGQGGVAVGDSARSVWRDDARGLVMEIEAEWRGGDGRVTVATAGAAPGREAWADINRIALRIPLANLLETSLPAYLAVAEAIAGALGWKVWDAQEDRYLLPRARRPSEPPIG
jgi:hypothetical protein